MRRRDFLGSAAGLSFLSLAGDVPGLFRHAAEASSKADANDHVLVVIELAGGNDGLNTVIPKEDALYYRNRRTLAIPKKTTIRLTDALGLHPKMGAFGELFREGHAAIVQGVGYPQPDRSHFRSMEIWHTASTSAKPPATGWLGRVLDASPAPAEAFPRGLSLTASLPQALQAERVAVPVLAPLDAATSESSAAQTALLRRLSAAAPRADSSMDFLRQQADAHYRTADRIQQASARYMSTVEYPESEIAGQLRRGAQVLASDLGVRVLFASQDGYDTHATQAELHGDLLEALSKALAAFQRDLTALKIADKVMVLVFSEFGRRVDENASKGTDHGAGSCLFVVGSKVKGGVVGTHPSLERLGDGDLIFHTDFRSVYATLLDRWLGCPSSAVLGAEYPLLDLIA